MTNILVGDCCKVLPELPRDSVDLIVADPPYNIGIDYGSGQSAEQARRLRHLVPTLDRSLLQATQAARLNLDHQRARARADIDIALQNCDFAIRNRITWHETFGVQCRKKFARTSRPIYYAVKDEKNFTFNSEAVTIPSARQEIYGDKRAAAGGKIMGDVWKISRVCGTFKERVKGVPTQLPSELVRRIVGVSSNPGDVVLDPFLGSGTTLAVAQEMYRDGVGIELNPEYAAIAQRRLREAETCAR